MTSSILNFCIPLVTSSISISAWQKILHDRKYTCQEFPFFQKANFSKLAPLFLKLADFRKNREPVFKNWLPIFEKLAPGRKWTPWVKNVRGNHLAAVFIIKNVVTVTGQNQIFLKLNQNKEENVWGKSSKSNFHEIMWKNNLKKTGAKVRTQFHLFSWI